MTQAALVTATALEALLSDTGTDAILVLNCPTAVASSLDAARAVIDTRAKSPQKPIVTSWLGEAAAE